MRRFVLAAGLALTFHILLFTVTFEEPRVRPNLPPRTLTLSLSQGTADLPPSPAEAKIPDPPATVPYPAQVAEEKIRPQKLRKTEKPVKEIGASVPLPREPADSFDDGLGSVAEEIPAPGAPWGSSSPALGSLGAGGQGSGTLVVREAAPLYSRNPVPEYPLIARRRGLQGVVLLEVLVDRQGGVADLRVFKSCGHSVLDQAALAGVKTWLFEPAARGEERFEMWVRVPVRFQLD